MRLSALILLLIVTNNFLSAQDLTNKGKDFWVGYGYHVRYVSSSGQGQPINGQEMVLYFATDAVSNITVSIPGVGYSKTYNNVPANIIFESDPLPKSGPQDARLTGEGLFQTGIHITSDKPIVAYTHIYNQNVSGASLLFPTNTLGKDYYSINYKQESNEANSNSFFFVVAADSGTTTVEITPAGNTLGHVSGQPFTVDLKQGQIYNVMGQVVGTSGEDMTGSRIRSISSGLNSCKRIAVFSGSGKITINCGPTEARSADNLIAQAFPKVAWGKKFLTAPTRDMPFNYFRIAVSDPAAKVKVNGLLQTNLVNNFYYDLNVTNFPQLIESDMPIMVAQYITTAGSAGPGTCGNRIPALPGDGDPEMIYLSPIEQTTDKVILNSTNHYDIQEHFINVIIKANAVSSVVLDNAPAGSFFTTHPADNQYAYAQIKVNSGQHSIHADSGFNVIAYGYGPAESYGYNGGTNIKDLYQFISIINPNSIVNEPTACSGSPFYFSITLPYQPLSLYWNFHDPNIQNQSVPVPAFDTSYISNGRMVYRYRLPILYTYKVGTYPITVIANNPTVDGCSGEQQIDFDLNVFDPPVSDFYYVSNGCVNTPVQFRDTSNLNGRPAYKWFWDFGDGNFSNLHNPVHTYATADTFKVRYAEITDIGCLSDTITKSVYITNVPTAAFNISAPYCIGSSLIFSDSSKLVGPGKLTEWIWNYNDGGTDTLLSNTSRTHQYNNPGTVMPYLIVHTSSGCPSAATMDMITIHPNPAPDFDLPVVCLPGGTAAFIDRSTIPDHSESQFKYLWNFGDPNDTKTNVDSVREPIHNYHSNGPFTIKLRVTSKDGCFADTAKLLTTVYAQTKSAFDVNHEYCLNDTTYFTDKSVLLPAPLIKWRWDFGDGTSDTVRNPIHVYKTSGSYLVKFYGTTINGCNSDTAIKTVVINPLPVAKFLWDGPDCSGKAINFTDQSTTAVGKIISWNWNFNDPANPASSTTKDPSYAYVNAGSYNVSLNIITDKGCKNLPDSMLVIVHPRPVAVFISPEICLHDAVAKFLDSSKVASGNISTYNWNFADPSSGGSNVSSQKDPSHLYTSVGNYPIKLTVTSDAGCLDTLIQTISVNGDNPVANFSITQPGGYCVNDSVTIRDASTVDFGSVTKIYIYWDAVNQPLKGDTIYNPTAFELFKHSYSNFQSPLNKSFTIRYISYSGNTCSDVISKSITVHAAPKVIFTSVPDICLHASPLQITQAHETGAVPGIAVYTGDGVSASGLFDPLAAGVGVHRILYTYTSSAGCIDTASNTINVLAPPIAAFTFSALNCQQKAISFADNSTSVAGSIVKYTWDFNDGSAPVVKNNAAPFDHIFLSAGKFKVSLVVTTADNCNSDISTRLVEVHPLPVPAFSASTGCLPNANVDFTNASSIADSLHPQLTYLWDFGDPNSGVADSSNLENPSHLYTAVGPYSIRLTATSDYGCIKDTAITDNDIHPQPKALFMPSPIEACLGSVIHFIDKSSGADGSVTQWYWDFGDDGLESAQNPVHTYLNAGTFTVSLSVINSIGCTSDTITLPVVIDSYPVVDAKPDRFVLEGDTIILSPFYQGTDLTYLWNPADYLNDPTVARPVLTGVQDMQYTITVTGKGDCASADKVNVKVLKAPRIPNTFTPNGDGINDVWQIENLQFYQNPRVQIFNRFGQGVFESYGYAKPWDGKLKGAPLPEGTYYYIIEPGNGRKPITGYVTILR